MEENANIRIIIDAIAEAAEEALDDVGDEILNLGGDASLAGGRLDEFSDEMNQATRRGLVLREALDEVQDAEEQLTVTSWLLQNAIDEVGDEMTDAAAKSGLASGAFTSLALSSDGASLSLGSLSSTLTLTLIPAILTLSTLLAPLAATLAVVAGAAVSLAGAFGLIVGSGILAFGEKRAEQNREELEQVNARIRQYEALQEQTGRLTAAQRKNLEALKQEKKGLEDATTAGGALAGVMGDLKEEIVPLIVEFGEEFVPLIEDAVNAVPELVERMFDAVGGTDEFKSALRDFGAIMMDVLPALVGIMFDLARDALPVLRDLASWLLENGPEAGAAMKESFEEIQPELMELIDALIELSPTLLEFGTVTAEVVLPVLTDLIRAMDGFMETVLALPEPVTGVVVAFLAFLPVIAKLLSGLSFLLELLGFGGITGALSSLATWLTTTIAGAAALGAAIGALGVIILDQLGILDAIEDAGEAVAEIFGRDMTDAFLVVATILTGGLFPVIAALGAAITRLVYGDIDGAIDAALQVFDIFGSAFANVGSIVWSILQGLGAAFVDFFMKTLPQVVVQGVSFMIAFWESGMNRVYNLFADVFQGIVNFGARALETFLNTMIDHVNAWLSTIDDVADTVQAVTGVDIGDVATLDRVDIGATDLGIDRRETDVGALQRRREEQLNTVINGGIQVDVTNDQDLGQNPYRSSRTFGDQLRREIRSKQGT